MLARMSSSRLPGKVLREVAGRSLLEHVLERVRRARELDYVVLATSSELSDDPLAAAAERAGAPVFRGDLSDVTGRVLACAREFGLDAVARVNGDSPWVDPTLLDRGVALMRESGVDLVTNVQERTFPYGVAVEVVRTAALERVCSEASDPAHFEHVTRLMYDNPECFEIVNLRSDDPGLAELRLTVDTLDDLQRFEELCQLFGDEAATVTTSQVAVAARARRPTPRPVPE